MKTTFNKIMPFAFCCFVFLLAASTSAEAIFIPQEQPPTKSQTSKIEKKQPAPANNGAKSAPAKAPNQTGQYGKVPPINQPTNRGYESAKGAIGGNQYDRVTEPPPVPPRPAHLGQQGQYQPVNPNILNQSNQPRPNGQANQYQQLQLKQQGNPNNTIGNVKPQYIAPPAQQNQYQTLQLRPQNQYQALPNNAQTAGARQGQQYQALPNNAQTQGARQGQYQALPNNAQTQGARGYSKMPSAPASGRPATFSRDVNPVPKPGTQKRLNNQQGQYQSLPNNAQTAGAKKPSTQNSKTTKTLQKNQQWKSASPSRKGPEIGSHRKQKTQQAPQQKQQWKKANPTRKGPAAGSHKQKPSTKTKTNKTKAKKRGRG